MPMLTQPGWGCGLTETPAMLRGLGIDDATASTSSDCRPLPELLAASGGSVGGGLMRKTDGFYRGRARGACLPPEGSRSSECNLDGARSSIHGSRALDELWPLSIRPTVGGALLIIPPSPGSAALGVPFGSRSRAVGFVVGSSRALLEAVEGEDRTGGDRAAGGFRREVAKALEVGRWWAATPLLTGARSVVEK